MPQYLQSVGHEVPGVVVCGLCSVIMVWGQKMPGEIPATPRYS